MCFALPVNKKSTHSPTSSIDWCHYVPYHAITTAHCIVRQHDNPVVSLIRKTPNSADAHNSAYNSNVMTT